LEIDCQTATELLRNNRKLKFMKLYTEIDNKRFHKPIYIALMIQTVHLVEMFICQYHGYHADSTELTDAVYLVVLLGFYLSTLIKPVVTTSYEYFLPREISLHTAVVFLFL
jgi:hypothetical protein